MKHTDRFRLCTKTELDAFVRTYPRELVVDVAMICEPPMRTWNDFSGGVAWPESVVAQERLNNESYDGPNAQNEYWIVDMEKLVGAE